jgi:hypothetical protein
VSKQYEVTAVTGKYTDRDGNEKSRYMTIGAVIQTKNGPMLKLEAVPVGWDGWAYLNEPKPKDEQPQRTHAEMKLGGGRQQQAGRAYGTRDDDGFEDSPPF